MGPGGEVDAALGLAARGEPWSEAAGALVPGLCAGAFAGAAAPQPSSPNANAIAKLAVIGLRTEERI
jgi:hypothetical protein